MLARLGEGLQTLAVAGTHGKTTTSSMLASVLDTMGLDPTFLIGGMVRQYGTNAHSGTGAYYVVEADESDKSFTYLSPAAVIVTNIEPDHLDHYANLDEIYDKFSQFIASVPAGAPVCVCAQDTRAVEIARAATQNVITYGLTPELQNGEGLTGDEDATSDTFGITPDAQITAVATHGVGSTFTLRLPSGRVVESAIKQNPGAHNVLNGAAVLTLLDALGQDVQAAAGALAQFAGVHRRFDLVGEAHDVTVVDDYGHHPTEIAATVRAALALDFKRVHVLFQPHRYSRVGLFTEVLHDQFAAAFDGAANVVFMDVYSAGETPVPGVTGQTFMNVLDSNVAAPARKFVPRRLDVPGSVCDLVRPGDLVITMGAGDVTEMGALILDEINRRAAAGTFAKERA
jgi:UDP-N-acetylmuramate--alanine ligase